MLPTTWTPEAARAGVNRDDIERANEHAAQAAQAAVHADLARIPALRAQAQEMIAVLLPGAAKGALEQALGWLDGAQDVAYQVAAVRQLDQAIQMWAQAAVIDRDLARLAAPARAADVLRQAAEAQRPKVLTVEEQIAALTARIEALERRP